MQIHRGELVATVHAPNKKQLKRMQIYKKFSGQAAEAEIKFPGVPFLGEDHAGLRHSSF
jgi:hypothetical protein